jgi:Phage capsid protein
MGLPNIDQTFILEYERAFQTAFQQGVSMTRDIQRNETQTGEKKAFTYIHPTSGITDRARQSASPNIPTQHSRRWSTMHSWTWSELVDDLDVINSLGDPSSEYLANAVKAYNRWEDEQFLARVYETVYSGKNGTDTVNWYDIGECRGMNSDGTLTTAGAAFTNTTETGLTIAKIGALGTYMGNNDIPETDRHIVANEDQKWYLLGHARATSKDYASAVSALVEGKLPGNYFLGFTFHWLPTSRFTYDGTDTGAIKAVAFHKSSMLRTTGMALKTRLAEESTNNFAVRVWAEAYVGGCRLDGKGVIPLALDPDPTIVFTN